MIAAMIGEILFMIVFALVADYWHRQYVKLDRRYKAYEQSQLRVVGKLTAERDDARDTVNHATRHANELLNYLNERRL